MKPSKTEGCSPLVNVTPKIFEVCNKSLIFFFSRKSVIWFSCILNVAAGNEWLVGRLGADILKMKQRRLGAMAVFYDWTHHVTTY
jgi:hypothetical protein